MKNEVDRADRRNYEKYYQIFNSNSHSGDFYRIKFKNDNVVYVGISMAGSSVMTGGETVARCYRKVRPARHWMSLTFPLTHLFLELNHRAVMRWGAEGMAEQLGVKVRY